VRGVGLAFDQFGKAAHLVQPIFITLDPERHTPRLLGDFVPMFHPRLIGLSSDVTEVSQAERTYKVYYAKVPTTDGSDYTIDRSAYIYLIPSRAISRISPARHIASTNGGSHPADDRLPLDNVGVGQKQTLRS
jgi:cytochrome oxidase Cu insertion factor (SCO1/SenC/PrrC family)